ncbi:hypothetical protein HER39_09605 [Arthrobacter deserti]|uniref:PE-PPE domain-containing protein n=1 Tax=Arthrobacter deserti TaxID=1742687 RepID=A0ABX1JRA9_9MICC|nr:hypothetical protein [Arthrobacter deserti]
MAEAVSRALDEAGAAAGEPVILVGYSQGGIHAMNLARNPEFLARHRVDYVLTAGSPGGDRPAAAGGKSLHLEHRQDRVPGADGMPNPDSRYQVTVALTGRVATPGGEDAGLGPGHRFANYLAGARALERSPDPSVADSAAAVTAAPAGGTARRHLFQLTRQPPGPGPVPGPRPGPGGTPRASGGPGGRAG